jgi:SAM-dependent methyltransferase
MSVATLISSAPTVISPMSLRTESSPADATVDGGGDIFVDTWLAAQAEHVGSEDWLTAIADRYPDAVRTWTDPRAQIKLLQEDTNFLKSAESLPWNELLSGRDLSVLDLGAGTGWLSLLISRYESVKDVTVLDSSRSNLEGMLPQIAPLMGGDLSKLRPVVGRFSPLLVPDQYFDVIVESSAIHHAESLPQLLRELARALKPNGYLVLINETILPDWMLVGIAVSRAFKIIRSVVMRRWVPDAPAISATTVVIDQFLGDRAYCEWQWQQALGVAGFEVRTIRTPFFTYNGDTRRSERTRLVNFICRKARG